MEEGTGVEAASRAIPPADRRRPDLSGCQSLAVQTFSPVVGVVLSNNARLLFQYDAIVDTLGRDARGVPTDLANDQWTVRSQVEF